MNDKRGNLTILPFRLVLQHTGGIPVFRGNLKNKTKTKTKKIRVSGRRKTECQIRGREGGLGRACCRSAMEVNMVVIIADSYMYTMSDTNMIVFKTDKPY